MDTDNGAAAWQDVIDTWFLDEGTGRHDRPLMKRWFSGGEAFDAQLRTRYTDTIEAAARGELDDWRNTAQGSLALSVLLDQMPRNIWRGTARAFSYEVQAMDVASTALAAGLDEALPLVQRVFLYLPLEHDESVASQRESLARFKSLAGVADAGADDAIQRFVTSAWQSAEEHAAIVERFGRYPHRNRVLQRDSSESEIAWLADSGSRFGQ